MTELAEAGIPVTVTCRVLKLARQLYYRWLRCSVTAAEIVQAYRANALFDAHRDDPESGHRVLIDEARQAGQSMADRTAWRNCTSNQWWSVFGKKRGKNGKRPGPPGHDDLVLRDFTAVVPGSRSDRAGSIPGCCLRKAASSWEAAFRMLSLWRST